MELPDIHVSDYQMTFEGAGVTFLYNYALGQYYWPVDTCMIVRRGAVQEYVSNEFLAQMDAEGLTRTPEEVHAAIERMRESVRRGGEEMADVLAVTLSKESTTRAFDLCATVMSNYYYFDPHFWDGVFQKVESDPAAKEIVELVQAYKNVARDEYNSYFFGSGHLSQLLAKLSTVFDIRVTDLEWYDRTGLAALFDNARVPEDEIANRKEIFFVYKKDGQASAFTGAEAQALADTFFAGDEIRDDKEFHGRCTHKVGGTVRGRVCNITRDYNDVHKMYREMAAMQQGDILVTQTTDPEMMPALRKAAAAVTDIGGMLSHTAIVARELNIPCVVDVKVASKILKTGDLIEVDADNGIVRKI